MTSRSEILLRLLGPGDATTLADLEARVFDDAWDRDRFEALLGQDRFLAAGAFDGPRLCAYLASYSLAGELEIVNVAVDGVLRGQGLGGALLRFVLDLAVRRGVGRIVLEVRADNAPALALYRSCGFRRVGLRPGYYVGSDALILAWTADGD